MEGRKVLIVLTLAVLFSSLIALPYASADIDVMWHNTSFFNRLDLSFTDALATDINRTGEIARVNVTGLVLQTDDCTELLVYNQSGSLMNYVILSNETTTPSDGSKWCELDFVVSKTDTTIDTNLTVYYNSTLIDLNASIGNMIGNTANYVYNGTSWSGIFDNITGVWNKRYDQNNLLWQPGNTFSDFNIRSNLGGITYLRKDAAINISDIYCDAISCKINIEGNNTGTFLNMTLYPEFIKVTVTGNGSTTADHNISAIFFSRINTSDANFVYACTFEGTNCIRPNVAVEVFGPDSRGVVVNTTGYDIIEFAFKNFTYNTLNISESSDADGRQIYMTTVSGNPGSPVTQPFDIYYGFGKTSGQGNYANSISFLQMFDSPMNTTVGNDESQILDIPFVTGVSDNTGTCFEVNNNYQSTWTQNYTYAINVSSCIFKAPTAGTFTINSSDPTGVGAVNCLLLLNETGDWAINVTVRDINGLENTTETALNIKAAGICSAGGGSSGGGGSGPVFVLPFLNATIPGIDLSDVEPVASGIDDFLVTPFLFGINTLQLALLILASLFVIRRVRTTKKLKLIDFVFIGFIIAFVGIIFVSSFGITTVAQISANIAGGFGQ